MGSRIGATLNFDISADLHHVKAPTRVVCAEDDLLTRAYFSREIAQRIPGTTLAMVERGGHALSRYDSSAFNARVLAFLDQQG